MCRPVSFPVCKLEEDIDGNPNIEAYEIITTQGSASEFMEEFEIGGLRVKSISTYDSNGAFATKSLYDYNVPNTSDKTVDCSGILMDDLIYFSKAYGLYSYNPRGFGQSGLQLHSSNRLRTKPSAQGNHIGYTITREIRVDENGSILGWTENQYKNQENSYYTDSWCKDYYQDNCPPISESACVTDAYILGLEPISSNGHLNGNVVETRVFDNQGAEIERTNYYYEDFISNLDVNNYTTFMGIYYGDSSNVINPCGGSNPFAADHSTYFVYQTPTYYSLTAKPIRTVNRKFYGNSEFYTEETFSYDEYLNLKTKESYVHENDLVETYYFYPYDQEVSSEPHMNDLLTENQKTSVVKSQQFRNQVQISEKLYTFDNSASTGGNTMVTAVESGRTGPESETTMNYDKYDSDGRLLQSTKENGISTTYIWGYNNQHIVAKLENQTYSTVQAAGVSSPVVDGLSPLQEAALRGLSGMVTTYTYEPLIGVTSITDPRGNTTYYQYDAENRLEYIRDKNNKIIEEYEYNITDIPSGNRGLATVSNPPIFGAININNFDTIDTSIDENGDKNLLVKLSLVDQTHLNGTTTINYSAAPYGGSGNYMYRWRIRGGSFGNSTSSSAWSYQFDCLTANKPIVQVICEITDTTTNKIYTERFTHSVNCQN